MITRAKSIEGQMVEGYLSEILTLTQGWVPIIKNKHTTWKVDSSTIEHKIGNEWYSMEELEKLTLKSKKK